MATNQEIELLKARILDLRATAEFKDFQNPRHNGVKLQVDTLYDELAKKEREFATPTYAATSRSVNAINQEILAIGQDPIMQGVDHCNPRYIELNEKRDKLYQEMEAASARTREKPPNTVYTGAPDPFSVGKPRLDPQQVIAKGQLEEKIRVYRAKLSVTPETDPQYKIIEQSLDGFYRQLPSRPRDAFGQLI